LCREQEDEECPSVLQDKLATVDDIPQDPVGNTEVRLIKIIFFFYNVSEIKN